MKTTLNGIREAHRAHTEIDIALCEIEQLTGLTPDAQRERMMEAGFEWLNMITGEDKQALHHIPRTQEFWGFWKIVWMRANRAFINWAGYALSQEMVEPYQLGFYFDCWHRISFDNEYICTPATDAGYHTVIKRLAVKR